jgi:hypothetical protein
MRSARRRRDSWRPRSREPRARVGRSSSSELKNRKIGVCSSCDSPSCRLEPLTPSGGARTADAVDRREQPHKAVWIGRGSVLLASIASVLWLDLGNFRSYMNVPPFGVLGMLEKMAKRQPSSLHQWFGTTWPPAGISQARRWATDCRTFGCRFPPEASRPCRFGRSLLSFCATPFFAHWADTPRRSPRASVDRPGRGSLSGSRPPGSGARRWRRRPCPRAHRRATELVIVSRRAGSRLGSPLKTSRALVPARTPNLAIAGNGRCRFSRLSSSPLADSNRRPPPYHGGHRGRPFLDEGSDAPARQSARHSPEGRRIGVSR